jgi:glycosidase
MSKWPNSPRVYEINSWVWLNELSHREGCAIGFGNVPEAEIERLAALGFDALWLMGVWQRSSVSREIALGHPGLCDAYQAALPDFTSADVVGSPFAVYGYQVDNDLGRDDGLASLRERMSRYGLQLILDFISNHFALDHPWLTEHPELFVQGTQESLQREPESYFTSARGVFAHGRDPYFPPWTDTVQLDYRVRKTREAMTELLLDVAKRCDGVRCDMAMLVTQDVFSRTWGGAFDPPDSEFWSEAIKKLRLRQPDFLMLAEVYWDKESDLQQQGFDYTYDKRLYDHLKADNADLVRLHVGGDAQFQSRLARFIENHDEPRALEVFGSQRSCAAATAALALPGLRLFHEGQLGGYRRTLPVQLRRRHREEIDPRIQQFYRCLLSALRDAVFQEGQWKMLNPHPAWHDNLSHNNFFAYQWIWGQERRLAVVNLSAAPSQCFLPLRELGIERGPWVLEDLVGDARYGREGQELISQGLYLDVPAHGCHLFKIQPSQLQFDQVDPPKPALGVKQKSILKGHATGIYGTAWSPNGRMLASVGVEKTISLWDVDKSLRI